MFKSENGAFSLCRTLNKIINSNRIDDKIHNISDTFPTQLLVLIQYVSLYFNVVFINGCESFIEWKLWDENRRNLKYSTHKLAL